MVDHDVITKTPIRYAVAFANEKTVIDLKKAPKEIENKVFRSDGIVSFIKAELEKDSPVYFKDGKMHELAAYIHGQHIDKHSIEVSEEELELKLKKFRKRLADETERKAFHIFMNKTLDSLVEMRPTTLDTLRKVEGIRDKKLEEFGTELVAIIGEVNDEL